MVFLDSPLMRPCSPRCMEQAEVPGVVCNQNPVRSSGQSEMRLVAGAVRSQLMSSVGGVAEAPQMFRKLTSNVVIQIECCHLGSVERNLRVNYLFVCPVICQRCEDGIDR